ncbi:hypothetical protein Taro_039453 [Colocasia esculenta]|uniref:Uncharacterized protein n=1 Tax=Colocasia esculenta TaxID=4460 RepID=A0A843WGP6_COLES|nr:hypothetical protein [Colocasia esculenta]
MRRELGQLPSQRVAKPRNHPPGFTPQICLLPQPGQQAQPKEPQFKNIKAISSLRSGKVLESPHQEKEVKDAIAQGAHEEESDSKEEPIQAELGRGDQRKGKAPMDPNSYQPIVPFPKALEVKPNRKKDLAQNEELLEMFKQVHINIPLINAIKHVLAYAKFLKELCTPRREPRTTPKKIQLSEDTEQWMDLLGRKGKVSIPTEPQFESLHDVLMCQAPYLQVDQLKLKVLMARRLLIAQKAQMAQHLLLLALEDLMARQLLLHELLPQKYQQMSHVQQEFPFQILCPMEINTLIAANLDLDGLIPLKLFCHEDSAL